MIRVLPSSARATSVVRHTVLYLSRCPCQRGLGPRDLGQDVLGAGGPDEGLGVGVVVHDVQVDGQLQFRHAGKAVALNAVLGDVTSRLTNRCEARLIITFGGTVLNSDWRNVR